MLTKCIHHYKLSVIYLLTWSIFYFILYHFIFLNMHTHTQESWSLSLNFANSSVSFIKFGYMQPVLQQLNLILTRASSSGSCTAPHNTTPYYTTNRTLSRSIATLQNWLQYKCSYCNRHRVEMVSMEYHVVTSSVADNILLG